MDRKQKRRGNQQSGARNLEAEIIRSGAESTRVCIECVLKTVTEIKRNSARNIFIAKNDYLVLNPLRGWEPVERLKEKE